MNNVGKQVLLLSPAISSLNVGDHIIVDGAKKQLKPLLDDSFVVEVSTHLPLSGYMSYLKNADYKFVCGSNLLRGKMNRKFRQWDIKRKDKKYLNDSILLGVGWWQYKDEPNLYTKNLYNSFLNKDYLHSVRDSMTEKKMKSMGFNNVINTACPTFWDLTPNHCSQIPTTKAKNVVTTITDYNKDYENDKQMLDILSNNYETVFCWIQGLNDYEYINKLVASHNNIKLIAPDLPSFDEILSRDDIEYVGTRLHAGVRSLQHKKRTLIIGIDNRAIEKNKDFNINVLNRDEISQLQRMIEKEIKTDIRIPLDSIQKWKSQFI